MTPIVLTPHQCEAVQFLADHIHDGDPIVALRGLAGTGKTSLIPALIAVLEGTGIPVTLGAPTHRAAMILRKKGLEQADTVHAHALTPYFTGDYTKAMRWLGDSCQCRIEDLANAQGAVDGVPWLVAERLKITGHTPEVVKARARTHEPKKALESIGIAGRHHFAGFGPKCGEGVLIIDEASMVGADMLKLCQEAFSQICLVGDPGQLPPVKDAAMLAHVPGFTLEEVHRQAADSKIIQLAYAARSGEKFWENIPYAAGEVEEYLGVEASAFLASPLVVWRNSTRLACTKAIRTALGYPADAPQVGEPLVCRSTDPRARSEGLYNNALFRVVPPSVVAMQEDNPRFVTVQPDGNPEAETLDLLVHMEETDGDNIDPDAILFRYGYTLTAHTAQGGEWPTVYISKPDLFAHTKRTPQESEGDDFARWAYTAITRAKVTLGFLRKHDFTATTTVAPIPWELPQTGDEMPKMKQEGTIAPPSAPMLTIDEPYDIADPPVPESLAAEAMTQDVPGLLMTAMVPSNGTAAPGTSPSPADATWSQHEALLHGFCQYMQSRLHTMIAEEHHHWTAGFDATLAHLRTHMQEVLQTNEHAQYTLGDALAKLHEHGANLVHAKADPYTAHLTARTPHGFALTLTIEKGTPGELIEELGRLEGWLVANGYTVTEGAAA